MTALHLQISPGKGRRISRSLQDDAGDGSITFLIGEKNRRPARKGSQFIAFNSATL